MSYKIKFSVPVPLNSFTIYDKSHHTRHFSLNSLWSKDSAVCLKPRGWVYLFVHYWAHYFWATSERSDTLFTTRQISLIFVSLSWEMKYWNSVESYYNNNCIFFHNNSDANVSWFPSNSIYWSVITIHYLILQRYRIFKRLISHTFFCTYCCHNIM